MPYQPPPTRQGHQEPIETFPSDLPPRVQNRPDRNLRTCFTFTWHAYSLRNTGTQAKLWRRISMNINWFLRFAISACLVAFAAYSEVWVTSLVIGIILLVIGFLSYVWSMAVIGEAEGTRKVLGIPFGRKHLDIFIHFSAVVHVVMMILLWLVIGGPGTAVWWNVMWVITIIYSVIAGLRPAYPTAASYASGSSYAQRGGVSQPGDAV